jgi:UDP-3-O-[3-hydroxymyristoyl] glucosamine N-acyltransferase
MYKCNFSKTVKQIAELVNGVVIGNEEQVVNNIADLGAAEKGDLSFLSNLKYTHLLKETKATAVIVDKKTICEGKSLIQVEDPSTALTILLKELFPYIEDFKREVHSSVVLGENVCLGKNICIEPNVVVGNNVTIGDNTVIRAGVFIGANVELGDDCFIYPNVVIREDVLIKNKVVIHSNSVIGSDGFGYDTVKGVHNKIPQIGNVVIEDDVEIGSNVSIDRARFDKTFIGQGTKIDNLVQIAHNVKIGKNCFVIALAGISGSVKIGDNVTIAGQVGTVGHIDIGSNIVIAARSAVTKSLEKPGIYSGFPIKAHVEERKIKAVQSKLPELRKKIIELEKKINELEIK